ncbi:EscU/YscU/HrcU family type III secretion system export apparatus switch protein [Diplocloster hominis]|uniref:EscU/YscU/HrcU family type III secretion system export apparatus switch protein n=1 Tax=Diplocloster hominis TaxID=3079010 RepID=UPI0031BB8DE6
MSKYKKRKAVALKYNIEEDVSPVVIASGYGTVAENIINIAEKKGIPVFKDDSAASMLCMLEVGSNIPTELYEVVAAIYCKLMETSRKLQEGAGPVNKPDNQPPGKKIRAGLVSARGRREEDGQR